MAEFIKRIQGGEIYRCKKCGEEFFNSYEYNNCQCAGCSDENEHKCSN